MGVTLDKTRPGSELHMGALLREALAERGVSVRVDRPWVSLPNEFLVAEREGYARVWIHAASCNSASHYDIPRAELMAVAAVVSDEKNTRFVYDGFADPEARPVEQAVSCARAVRDFLGLDPVEPPCTWCAGYGFITLYDPSTDGITGHRPCDDPACVASREAATRARDAEQQDFEERAAEHARVCPGDSCCPPF